MNTRLTTRCAALLRTGACILTGAIAFFPASAQVASCATAPPSQTGAADVLYAQGKIEQAEILYQQALATDPANPLVLANLVRTQLRLDDVTSAATTVQSALPRSARSAPLMTAFAEVQIREGQPWLALDSLRTSEAIDPCYARTYLIRSRIDRLDSMHASERAAIAHAYSLDPADADIKRAWNRTVTPANDIISTEQYLEEKDDLEPELRKSAEASVQAMLPLLSETSQTCKILPPPEAVTLPLLPSMQDGRHVDGYRLEVGLPSTRVALGLDTAASGVYLSKDVAKANGLEYRLGDPLGTVHVDALRLGSLTLRDCVVGVSETPFLGKGVGMIGTDLFEPYLVTLNFPSAKLELTPLPAVKGKVPLDRPTAADLQGFSPVYHRQQFLLVPVTIDGKERRLFALDSGMRMSTMTLPLAHLVSTTQHGFTNTMTTTSGANFQVFRDGFDFEFANLVLRNRHEILQFDPTAIEQRTGMNVGGLLGFDLLRNAVLHLDYRDGLIRIDFPNGEATPSRGGSLLIAGSGIPKAEAEQAACPQMYPELPASSTIQARNAGYWDVAHMKTGEAITVKLVHDFETLECRMETGGLLYGHVTYVAKAAADHPAQLGIAFQRAECQGKGTKTLPLKLVSVVAVPGTSVSMHSQLPAAIGGGRGRQISDTVDALSQGGDQNLTSEGKPLVIQTGSVPGIPNLRLSPEGGPSCSALISSSNGILRLQQETKFLLVVPEAVSR